MTCSTLFALNVSVESSASTGARFLDIPQSARYAAMGNAGTAAASGVESIFINPAGTCGGGNGILAAHNSWLDGVLIENAAVSYLIMKGMAIGAALSYADEGTTDKYGVDVYGNPVRQGQVSGKSFILKGNYSMQFLKNFSAGINMGFAGEYLGESAAGAFVTDIGLQYINGNGFGAGISAKNMGTKINNFDLAVPISGGICYKKEFTKEHSMTAAAEIESDTKANPVFGSGVEYAFLDSYFLRVGYSTDNTDSKEGISGIRAGAGIKAGTARIDYSFEPYGELGISNKISLFVGF
jgi:hypothetical protein